MPLDGDGTTVSWAMADDGAAAAAAARAVAADAHTHLAAKTAETNRRLNDVVPYFRCSDEDIVKASRCRAHPLKQRRRLGRPREGGWKAGQSPRHLGRVYYFLWALYLMYFTRGDGGMQVQSHTQTAVNNFLGMHRYDAVFQIRRLVGPRASTGDRATRVHTLTRPRHREARPPQLTIASPRRKATRARRLLGRRSPTATCSRGTRRCGSARATAARQLRRRGRAAATAGGDRARRRRVAGVRALEEHDLPARPTPSTRTFWEKIGGTVWGQAYDSVLALKMAAELGVPECGALERLGRHAERRRLAQRPVGGEREGHVHDTSGGMGWGNVAYSAMSLSRAIDVRDGDDVARRPDQGLFGEVPLTCVARRDWPPPPVDPNSAKYNFMVTPDANWYMLRGLFLHQVDALAVKFTLAHLKRYNMEWGLPVAPETRRMNFALHGDQWSNFNAGKILLLLEGIGGLRYSAVDSSFTFADVLPTNWSFMEYGVPVQAPGAGVSWATARAERRRQGDKVVKTVTVQGNPFRSRAAAVGGGCPRGGGVPPPADSPTRPWGTWAGVSRGPRTPPSSSRWMTTRPRPSSSSLHHEKLV